MSIEYKTLSMPVVSIEDRIVTGFASVLGNVDDGNDITHPGAFTKTIRESGHRVRHLWQHDTTLPPTAKILDLREVGREELPADLREQFPDAKGALLVRREYLQTPRADEILHGIKAGAIGEMSFGYEPIKKDYARAGEKSIRHLREVKLFETSDVQWGMNPATRAAKSAEHADLEQLIHDMDGLATAVRVEIKAGRLINAETKANMTRILSALQGGIAELDNQLNTAEPDKPLTVDASGLFARLAIAEREFQEITG